MVEKITEDTLFPGTIPNWINNKECFALDGEVIIKYSPHSGEQLALVSSSKSVDTQLAIDTATSVQSSWSEVPPVQRGYILHQVCNHLEKNQDTIAKIVSLETGKSYKEAFGEAGGAIALGRFFAGEGQRLYGRTTTSGQADKYAMTVRQPCGVAGLIVAANTPIANVAWKVFPALICGNAAVLKAPEDTPATAWVFAKLAYEAGLPKGVLNVIQGLGVEAGALLAESAMIDVLSFTGSTAVGRWIAEVAGKRLAKVSLELGGKNPFIVCDDANLDKAVEWACLSAFSNGGQRCAAGSRIIVFDAVYERFRDLFVEAASKLNLGPSDEDDLGAVINERQLDMMITAVKTAAKEGSDILFGGDRATTPEHINGYYMTPTIIDNIKAEQDISQSELFGPIAQLYRVKNFDEALSLANQSPYGLTACIHTTNFDRAYHFAQKVHAGVAVVNAGTYGSEPHMPFGGVKASGNGSREPGTEALDVYCELKDIYINVDRDRL